MKKSWGSLSQDKIGHVVDQGRPWRADIQSPIVSKGTCIYVLTVIGVCENGSIMKGVQVTSCLRCMQLVRI